MKFGTLKNSSSGILKYLAVFFLKVTGIVLTFLVQIYIARKLGVTEFGFFTYVLSWLTLISLFSTFGFEQLLTKSIASLKSENKLEELNDLLRSSFLSVLFISSILLLILVLIISFITTNHNKQLSEVFISGVIFIPLMAILRVNSGIMKGYKKPIYDAIIVDFLRPLIFFCGILIFFSLFKGISASLVMLIQISSLMLLVLFSLLLVYKFHYQPSQQMRQKLSSKNLIANAKSWSKIAVPFITLSMIIQIERNTDILMLGALDKIENAGVYAIASRITNLLLVVHMTLNTIAGAKFSELYTQGNIHELQILISKLAKLSAAASLLAIVFISIFSDVLLGFFGAAFISGSTPLKILISAQFIKTLVGPALLLAMMAGYQKQSVRILAVGALLNIVLNSIFIPLWGMTGAAVATSISIVFWCVWLAIYLKKELGINTTVFTLR